MTPAALYAFIKAHIPLMMQRIERSARAKHLVYAEDIYPDYASEADFINAYAVTPKDFYCFYTSASCFEIKKSLSLSGITILTPRLYQIKKGISLSDALENILNEGITVIDCIEAINIAWCLCIEALLIKCYGEKPGKIKFNQLLNSENQPFQLSAFDINQMTGNRVKSAYVINVPILSYFIEDLPYTSCHYNTAKEDIRLTPGARLTLYNVPEYKAKHVIGNAGAINLMCIDQNSYMGFGLGECALTEDQVNAWLKKNHEATTPLEQRIPWLNSIANVKKMSGAPLNNIYPAGYIANNSEQLCLSKLALLTEEDGFQKTLDNIKVFIREYKSKQSLLLNQNYGDFYLQNLNATSSLSLSERTQMILKAEYEKKDDTTHCKEILLKLTQRSFYYSAKQSTYWMLTETIEEAKHIAAQLNQSSITSKVSYGKIKITRESAQKYPNMNYRVTVATFNPKLITLERHAVNNSQTQTFKI